MFQEVTLQASSYYEGSPSYVKAAARAMMITVQDLIVTKGRRGDEVDVSGGVEIEI